MLLKICKCDRNKRPVLLESAFYFALVVQLFYDSHFSVEGSIIIVDMMIIRFEHNG